MMAFLLAAVLGSTPVQGRAVVDCAVAPDGRISACVTLSETPAGANVGDFAVKLAQGFRVDPKDRRIRQGRIRIPMQFKLPKAP